MQAIVKSLKSPPTHTETAGCHSLSFLPIIQQFLLLIPVRSVKMKVSLSLPQQVEAIARKLTGYLLSGTLRFQYAPISTLKIGI